jgi:hypothetical protein
MSGRVFGLGHLLLGKMRMASAGDAALAEGENELADAL